MGGSRGSLNETPRDTEGIMGSITFEKTGDESHLKQCRYTKLNNNEFYLYSESSFLLKLVTTVILICSFHLVCTNTFFSTPKIADFTT